MNLAKEFGHDFKNGKFHLTDKFNMIIYTESESGKYTKKKYYGNGRIKHVYEINKDNNYKLEAFYSEKGNLIYKIIEEGTKP